MSLAISSTCDKRWQRSKLDDQPTPNITTELKHGLVVRLHWGRREEKSCESTRPMHRGVRGRFARLSLLASPFVRLEATCCWDLAATYP